MWDDALNDLSQEGRLPGDVIGQSGSVKEVPQGVSRARWSLTVCPGSRIDRLHRSCGYGAYRTEYSSTRNEEGGAFQVSISLVHVTKEGLEPYVEGLRCLEEGMLYPIGDGEDQFHIDHGPQYHPFFSHLGESHFLVALDGRRVVGNIVAVRRCVQLAGQPLSAFYMCDYKLAPSHRGGVLSTKIWMRCLKRLALDRRLWGWRLVYGAAMRGQKGDVSRSFRGRLHPGRLFRPAARTMLYFVPPQDLANLDTHEAPAPPSSTRGLDLSYDERAPLWLSTSGRKDLRLVSTGQPWPLVHLPLGPSAWRPTWGHYLARCGQALLEEGHAGPACFGIDARLEEDQRWLSGQGVVPGAVCTIHLLCLPGLLKEVEWIHLATSEI